MDGIIAWYRRYFIAWYIRKGTIPVTNAKTVPAKTCFHPGLFTFRAAYHQKIKLNGTQSDQNSCITSPQRIENC